MGGQSKVFTLAEVSNHNNAKDCWLIISGKDLKVAGALLQSTKICFVYKVYNVTKFLEDHPGGDDVLLSSTGKDATDDFEDVGHSSSARAMLDEYYAGDIDSSTIPTNVKYTPPKQPHYNQDKTTEFIVKLLQFLVPLIILGVAFGVHFYTKQSA
ncbi:PREDICTED: cytochrome b5, seed isoform isoform X1 [Nicotiana attenuata]|uniref:cytochrome b5, seed isoform isoform X1 n=1 Tax=Nicotiana attenuata TaxID=49451 RepID=UPI0009054218|nr:PREDICTED: cytochrome b5, seed isoform isoform X1 [Nicotiana attenuata]